LLGTFNLLPNDVMLTRDAPHRTSFFVRLCAFVVQNAKGAVVLRNLIIIWRSMWTCVLKEWNVRI
jgi:hypothetical protein